MPVGDRDHISDRPLDIGEDRIATILGMIERGWERVRDRTEIRAGAPEVELNEWLRDGMRDAVDPRAGGRRLGMLVAPGTETRSTPQVRRPDGLTDIPLYFVSVLEECAEHDPHAIIECKRIAGDNAQLRRRYVVRGIDDRFVSGKYGRWHATGFMVGYVESGNADLAATGINRYLFGQNRHDELLGPCTVLNADWARSSRHPRPSVARPIDLHHVFLEFA